jgi:hypothetical protein
MRSCLSSLRIVLGLNLSLLIYSNLAPSPFLSSPLRNINDDEDLDECLIPIDQVARCYPTLESLSVKDSVAGLNLTEASHVVIFHPFLVDGEGKHSEDGAFDSDIKMALSFEKQGIARAWRSGQTKQVIRPCVVYVGGRIGVSSSRNRVEAYT